MERIIVRKYVSMICTITCSFCQYYFNLFCKVYNPRWTFNVIDFLATLNVLQLFSIIININYNNSFVGWNFIYFIYLKFQSYSVLKKIPFCLAKYQILVIKCIKGFLTHMWCMCIMYVILVCSSCLHLIIIIIITL